ncbi:MAG: DSD1 family PLP-dependent enzyme [Actinomycetota bacterium]|nr:DSD1 family PLP-dependent enzyme [Actinomycetota bacterium]
MIGTREQWVEPYRNQIGRVRNDVTTPALLLDLDAAKRNIATMAGKFRAFPAKLRPHVKVHKCVELARMHVDAGAVGVACATAWEAIVMANGGIGDVLIANQLVQPDKVAAIAELAREHRITVTVDDTRNVEQLSRAAAESGSQLELLIEFDVGMGRCGVRSKQELLPIAERIASLPNLTFRGLQAYEGHCMLEPDREKRIRDANTANEQAVHAAHLLAEHGHPCAEISAGGTGTYFIAAAHPGITEVQAGSYALMDCFHGNLVPGGFEVALTVLGTVISRQDNRVVLDCGRKAVGIDFVTPPLVSYPEAEIRYYAEEHCLVDFPGTPPLDLGDRAEAMAGYGPTTVNLHDVFHVIENGVVTDIWPVNPRGAGPPAFV